LHISSLGIYIDVTLKLPMILSTHINLKIINSGSNIHVFEKNESWFRGFSNLARRVSGASKIVLVDSFNDWNRGTQLESADTYGEDFLQILKEEFKVN